jgi:hypothetical protein
MLRNNQSECERIERDILKGIRKLTSVFVIWENSRLEVNHAGILGCEYGTVMSRYPYKSYVITMEYR